MPARADGNFARDRGACTRARRAAPAATAAASPAVRRRLGVDRERLRAVPRLSRRAPARSANTTASSCATRWCCAAARARRRARTSAPTYRNFFPPGGALAVQRHPAGARRLTADAAPSGTRTRRCRQTAARALLESTTLDGAVAEILGAISNELDWPLAIYWIAGADDSRLRCRSIWAAETLKRADVVEASRVAIVAPDAEDDPAGRAYGRREPVWIEQLAAAPARPPARGWPRDRRGARVGRRRSRSPTRAGAVGAIELYAPHARPARRRDAGT